ncbi:MAG: serine hydrolase [Chitinophagales bacterium]
MRRPQIRDGKTFGRIPLPKQEGQPYKFAKQSQNVELPELIEWAGEKAAKKYADVNSFVEDNHTSALLIIRNDTILYERYYNGFTDSTITQVFSVTKPLIASLLSQALDEGRIESLDEPVIDYLCLKGKEDKCQALTFKHLAQMQSGINHYDYRRIFKVLRLYYAKDLDTYVTKARVGRMPGGKFYYKSFDTQALGMCLEQVFQEDNLMNRFVGLYWENIHPEYKGYFSVDGKKNKNPKYFGGLNISARDLAKIGKIYMNDGQFEGKQVINEDWVHYVEDTTNHVGKWDYGLGWYFDAYSSENEVYYGSGFNGQFLVINKTTNTIIVRLGEKEGGYKWWSMLTDLSKLF